jgi:hypothetical protein
MAIPTSASFASSKTRSQSLGMNQCPITQCVRAQEYNMNEQRIEEAIAGLESFPLTEDQQALINYLRANKQDIEEALSP